MAVQTNPPLSGKAALVTGGSRSIGAAIARKLAADGAAVAINYHASPAKAKQVVGDIEAADYQRMVAVNVTGVFVATQEAARHMKAGGRLIHIGSSMARYAAFGSSSVYTLTKGAVAGFNRSLVRDLGPKGITVNTVMPGPTDTDMNPKDGPIAPLTSSGIAIGRYDEDAEIAAVVAFLASPAASFVTGAEVMADGGLSA